MQQDATIERKYLAGSEAERILARALRGRKGALTRADAVALTGLPADETESALKSLLSAYRSHLAVTDDGELIYQFDPAMVRRDRVSLGERLAAAGQAAWRAFTLLFKVWIVVTLVVYVVAFVAMLVALIFARSASDRDDCRRGDGGGFGFPWLLWWMMPDWAPPEVRRRLPARRTKRFYLSVFDFVFGPRSAPADALGDEKQVLAYLRTAGGRITATDLVALTGWSYDRAEQEATRLLADYDGEPEVTDEGTIVYSFPELRKTTGDEAPGPWLYTWQEKRALPELTGNTEGTNVVIALMNGFNLFASLAIAPAFLARFGVHFPGEQLAVTWFPLAFSSIFFTVPGLRWWRRRRLARRLEAQAARAALIGELVARKGAEASPDELAAAAGRRTPGISQGVARAQLERLLAELEGDVTTDGDGAMRYSFPRITEELAAAQKARALAPAAEATPGTVVFTSSDEPTPLKPPSRLN